MQNGKVENGTSSPRTIKLAEYLFTRLKQLGIGAIHGVPGDYNLDLLDYVEPSGLQWVGNANELNAGYAADGYARIKRFGSLITTFGVGELSAINAIAGAYTERAAVVHIVGTPPRRSQDMRLDIHHTLGDGEYGHFAQMSSHVTVAQTDLKDSRTAPEQIDKTLQQCMLHSRPVYIQVPVDMVAVPVHADRLDTNITIPEIASPQSSESALNKVLDKIYAAKQPFILVDGETRALGLVEEVHQLIHATQWPTFTTGFGKGLIDETLPNVFGIYQGKYSDSSVQQFVKDADLVLCFGPHFSTTNSFQGSAIPKVDLSILFTWSGIKIGSETLRDVSLKSVLTQLLQKLDTSKAKTYGKDLTLPHGKVTPFSDVSADGMIKQDHVWRLLNNCVQPGDIVFGETGTAGYGSREMTLPKHTRLFTPVTWLSIGYMLPACQGAALAQRELISSSKYHDLQSARTVLLIGDGSFQMTVQELGTIIRLNLDVIIFLINNDGYTIERCIHGLREGYNDISPWRYLQAPSVFGASDNVYTASAKTYGELEKVLSDEKMTKGKGLRMVEVFMEREDAPAGVLTDLLNMQIKAAEQKK